MARKIDRCETVTQKIGPAQTGFKASVFLHIDHLDGKVLGVRLSEKGKDGSTLDRLLHAIGDAATELVKEIQGQAV